MVRRFVPDESDDVRALQVWLILIAKAQNRQTLTYRELAEIVGTTGPGSVTTFLPPIAAYCQQKGLPALTMLVVRENLGVPGEATPDLEDPNREREKVFSEPWYHIYPPTPEEFERAFERAMEAGNG